MILVPANEDESGSIGSHSSLLGEVLLHAADLLYELLNGHGRVIDISVILSLDSHLIDESLGIGSHTRNHDVNMIVDFEDFVAVCRLD